MPRLLTRLVTADEGAPLGARAWLDTRLLLPDLGGRRFKNVFTGEELTPADDQGRPALTLAEVFGHFPVALFVDV